MDKLTVRNTHGDYFISQFICNNDRLSAVIDWTSACAHPVIWEITRSFAYAAPCCAVGEIDEDLFDRYVDAYQRYGTLNDYDYKNIYRLYFYQIAVCDYYGHYFSSKADNKIIYLKQAKHATRVLEKTAKSMIEKGII